MTIARAVVAPTYGGPEVLEVREVEVPDPGAGEVTIEVRAAGLNPVDHTIASGHFPGREPPLEAEERQRILDALETCAGNQTHAANLLGVSRRTLINKLDKFALPRPRKK